MLEPYSKARLINVTLNHRTKPFKLPAILYWSSRFITNILRWIYIILVIHVSILKSMAICFLLIWPLILFFSVSIKQMISCCKQQPHPCCKVIILFFLSKCFIKYKVFQKQLSSFQHIFFVIVNKLSFNIQYLVIYLMKTKSKFVILLDFGLILEYLQQ